MPIVMRKPPHPLRIFIRRYSTEISLAIGALGLLVAVLTLVQTA